MDVTIETVDRVDGARAAVTLQEEIWGYGQPDTDHPLPARVLLAIARSGGLVAVASDGETPVALSVAWVGRIHDSKRLFLQSQMVGVVRSHRHRGLGYRMKLHQREFALGVGIDLIRWTFDPLQSANARLNLHKLGATAHRYHPDYFGAMRSVFNAGIASDRLWAEWAVDTRRVGRSLAGERPSVPELAQAVNRPEFDEESESLRPGPPLLGLSAPTLKLTIPDDFDRMRRRNAELAAQWRECVREALLHYFEAGYRAVDLQLEDSGTGRRACYVLSRE